MADSRAASVCDARVQRRLDILPRVGGAFAEVWHAQLVEEVKAGRPSADKRVSPIAPFDRDPATAVAKAFDRNTGRKIEPPELRTYAEGLAIYHVSP